MLFVREPKLNVVKGKGYPDRATRSFVKNLCDCLPDRWVRTSRKTGSNLSDAPFRVPIWALVDADAFGLDILSVYRNGSQSLRHENSVLAAGPRLQWLGIQSSEVIEFVSSYDYSKCGSPYSG
jgi:meiotic recombination protein SPO11